MKNTKNQRRKQLIKIKLMMLAGGILLIFAIILIIGVKNDKIDLKHIFNKRSHLEPPDNPSWITQEFIPVNEFSRPGDKLDIVNGIVVHYVGNPGSTAEGNRSYFASLAETGDTYASAHFVIDLDGSIIQCVPLDEIAYCSNKRNVDTISIECCHPDETGQFTDATYNSLVRLVNWLVSYYDLNKKEIIRHYDVTGKECPLYFVDNPDEWAKFKNEIKFK